MLFTLLAIEPTNIQLEFDVDFDWGVGEGIVVFLEVSFCEKFLPSEFIFVCNLWFVCLQKFYCEYFVFVVVVVITTMPVTNNSKNAKNSVYGAKVMVAYVYFVSICQRFEEGGKIWRYLFFEYLRSFPCPKKMKKKKNKTNAYDFSFLSSLAVPTFSSFP